MRDFAWSPEDVAFKEELEAFLDKEMPPFVEQWSDNEDAEASRGVMGVMDKRKAWQHKLNEGRWAAILWPEEWGGRAATTAQSVIYTQVMAKYRSTGIFNANGIVQIGPSIISWGTDDQKARWLPGILDATEHWCQGFSEPQAGSDLANLRTTAILSDDESHYVVNGQKVWISRVQHSDLMILLARTTPLADVKKKSEGMSIFLVDLRTAIGKGMTVRPIRNMVNHETNELFLDNLEIPAQNLIGEEGNGFKYILDGLNAERVLIAAECIGDGYWFIERVTKYVKDRVVFGRPIGQNQGVQFPIAESYIEVEAANLMRWKACELFDAHQPCGAEANMAKYLAAKASWEAANACLQFHGGFGFASEYDVERKFRETRLYQVAPISTNLILSYIAEHVLGLPRSF
jgi:acyl-CoA dehydrogenase